jgi:hypothetical protein
LSRTSARQEGEEESLNQKGVESGIRVEDAIDVEVELWGFSRAG